MFSIPEQFSAVTNFQSNFQTQLQSQLNFVNTVASQAVDSASKVVALNINAARASVEKSTSTARHLLNVKDAQEFFHKAFQPSSLDSLVEYGRELYAIAAAAQAELFKATSEQTKDVVPAAVLKLAGPAKAVKQIVVTDEEAPAPKAAKVKAKPAAEAEVEAAVEEEEAKPPFPTAASVEADAKPAKVKAKPVH